MASMFQTALTEIIKSGILPLEGIKIASVRMEITLNTRLWIIYINIGNFYFTYYFFPSVFYATKLVKLFVNFVANYKNQDVRQFFVQVDPESSLFFCQDEF